MKGGRIIIVPPRILPDEIEEQPDIAFVDHQSPIHIGLTHFQRWIKSGPTRASPIGKPDYDRLLNIALVAIDTPPSASINDGKRPFAYEPAQKRIKHPHEQMV